MHNIAIVDYFNQYVGKLQNMFLRRLMRADFDDKWRHKKSLKTVHCFNKLMSMNVMNVIEMGNPDLSQVT